MPKKPNMALCISGFTDMPPFVGGKGSDDWDPHFLPRRARVEVACSPDAGIGLILSG